MLKSVCGYCGVGCGLEFEPQKLIGDLAYPSNEGVVCAKGVSELMTIDTPTRLLRPQIRETLNRLFEPLEWEMAMSVIVDKIRKSDPERIALYLSGQMLTEDYYVANKLGKGFIGTNNVDTNSRTCMSSAVAAHKKVFGIDYVPVRMEDVDHADLLILTGANPAEAHVVFHNRIKKAQKRGLKVIVIDPRLTESAQHADLHIPLRVGSDIDFFSLVARRIIEEGKTDEAYLEAHVNGYAHYKAKLLRTPKTKMLKRCGIDEALFESFMALFYASENIISAWTMGVNQSAQGVDKNIAIINLHLLTGKIGRRGNGPMSLSGQPNAMGGREVGALSNMLAVHLDFEPESIRKVGEFWGTQRIQQEAGLSAFEIIEAAERGKIDLLIICHTDPVYHLPNRSRVEAALKKIPFVVEINAYDNSESKAFAHLRLPAAPWGEKEGTQTNMDRTVMRQERLTRRSIDCKPDWEIFAMIGRKLGFEEAFRFESAQEVFSEYSRMTRLSPQGHLNIYEADYEALREKPFVWGEGLFTEHHYFTPDKKANLLFVENLLRSERVTLNYPYTLITGRIRDQWHSMTKTGFVPRLQKHKPSSFVEINSEDAASLGIRDGDRVRVSTQRGELVLSAVLSDGIRPKTIFIPVTERRVNYLSNDLLDPSSKQPDYNHNAAKISRMP